MEDQEVFDKKSKLKSILSLPQEIFDQIVCQEAVELADVYSLLQVCTRFKDALGSNEVWRLKMMQRWPGISEKLGKQKNVDWKQRCRERVSCGAAVWEEVARIPRLCFDKEELPRCACEGLVRVTERCHHGMSYVTDELNTILNHKHSKKNLTHKYYALRALRLLHHHDLEDAMGTYMRLQPGQQCLEYGACVIACWCEATLDLASVCHQVALELTRIAALVRTDINKRDSNHPAGTDLSQSQAELTALEASLWKPEQVRVVLESLNQVLFQQLSYKPNESNYYDVNNSFINQVLSRRTGIPISLSVVYMSVARRLGVVCEPVNFPQHFLLKWKQHPNLGPDEQYTYIDMFRRGECMNQHDCVKRLTDGYLHTDEVKKACASISMVEVLRRMVRNLYAIAYEQGSMGDGIQSLCDILQLTILLDGRNINARISLAKFYLNLDVNLEEADQLLELFDNTDIEPEIRPEHRKLHLLITATADRLLEPIDNTDIEPQSLIRYLRDSIRTQKTTSVYPPEADALIEPIDRPDIVVIPQVPFLRESLSESMAYRVYPPQIKEKKRSDAPPEVQFSVGLIMKHKKYDYVCVVYGWDGRCQASTEWIHHMGVHNLPLGQYQPFYNVLVQDGSNRYAAQENLSLCESPEEISHPQVGKYFSEFCDTYYRPNSVRQEIYPEDLDCTLKYVDTNYRNSHNSDMT